MPASILLLAAGASTRMRGEDKLLRMIDGAPLLLRQARRALRAAPDVTVVLPRADRARRAWLMDLPLRIAPVDTRAMADSLRAGLQAAPPGPVLILLADMPEITTDDIATILRAGQEHPQTIVRATSDSGTPGHPVLFPDHLRPALMHLSGDRGAGQIIAQHGAHLVALPGTHATLDLDTPEDWAAWQATP